ncbi:hypothetical protein L7F22_062259 [Adiantum nelumboides]|nr:hypothetical protein [Adiantum nelumboides]
MAGPLRSRWLVAVDGVDESDVGSADDREVEQAESDRGHDPVPVVLNARAEQRQRQWAGDDGLRQGGETHLGLAKALVLLGRPLADPVGQLAAECDAHDAANEARDEAEADVGGAEAVASVVRDGDVGCDGDQETNGAGKAEGSPEDSRVGNDEEGTDEELDEALLGLAGKGAAFAATAIHLTAAAIHSRALDTAAIAQQRYGNDSAWYHDRIPFLDSSDDVLNKVYYYRWNIFRAHQRDLGDLGYISTEFLDDVSWQQQPYASLNDATGFHLGEGRWCRDRRFKEDYLDFMLQRAAMTDTFSDYMAHASYQTYLVDGDQRSATSHIESMKNIYGSQWGDHLDATKGLYWIVPLDDATEYTIASIDASGGLDGFTGGAAFRPSINAYMFANFKAIAAIAQLAGQEQTVVDSYNARASDIKKRMQADLWNATLGHFIDRFQVSNKYVQYYEPIRGRELVGMVPWLFDLPDDKADYAGAWKHVFKYGRVDGQIWTSNE